MPALIAVPLRELWWLARGTVRIVGHYPRTTAIGLVALLLLGVSGHTSVVAVVVLLVLAVVAWARVEPASFGAVVSRPVATARLMSRLRKQWPAVAVRHGFGGAGRGVPVITQLRGGSGQVTFIPALRPGDLIEEIEVLAEPLRQALKVAAVSVIPDVSRSWCKVLILAEDPLSRLVPTPPMGSPEPAVVTLGVTERGGVWRLPLGPHALVAGCSGSGKASLVWGLLRGLAPAIRSGAVEVHGIDLKGGMELGFGHQMLTRYARSAQEAVQLLEEAAAELQARAIRLSGVTRQHTVSPASPLVVVLIDELASITAYLPDRDMTRRVNAALSIILSQGRAAGFMVFACLQDPRKEVIPARGLFLQTVALRLRDRVETQMVLGDGAIDAGALCHRIPVSMPGTGYVTSPENGSPTRVRAAYVSDDEIRATAENYPALRPRPLSKLAESEPTPTARRTKARGL